ADAALVAEVAGGAELAAGFAVDAGAGDGVGVDDAFAGDAVAVGDEHDAVVVVARDGVAAGDVAVVVFDAFADQGGAIAQITIEGLVVWLTGAVGDVVGEGDADIAVVGVGVQRRGQLHLAVDAAVEGGAGRGVDAQGLLGLAAAV